MYVLCETITVQAEDLLERLLLENQIDHRYRFLRHQGI